MTYSQYAYVEAFLDMKQKSWINAHVHMYEYIMAQLSRQKFDIFIMN